MNARTLAFGVVLAMLGGTAIQAEEGRGHEPGDKVDVGGHGALTGADERQGRPAETARPSPQGARSTPHTGGPSETGPEETEDAER